MKAPDVLAAVLRDAGERKGLAEHLLQVGGDATDQALAMLKWLRQFADAIESSKP